MKRFTKEGLINLLYFYFYRTYYLKEYNRLV